MGASVPCGALLERQDYVSQSQIPREISRDHTDSVGTGAEQDTYLQSEPVRDPVRIYKRATATAALGSLSAKTLITRSNWGARSSVARSRKGLKSM